MALKAKEWAKRYRLVFLTLTVVVGIAVFFEILSFGTQKEISIKSPRYLLAARDLSEGSLVHFRDLEIKSFDETEIDPGTLTDQDLGLLRGAVVKKTLMAGEFLSLDKIILAPKFVGLAPSIPEGFRAYLLKPANSPLVERGDRIDIVLTPESHSERPEILAEAVQILLTRKGGGEIVVALSLDSIDRLEAAKSKGKITVLLRAPGDESIQVKKKKIRKKKVEIWLD